MKLSLVSWLALALASSAVELPMELDELKVRTGRTYEKVKITSADAIGVKIVHSAGTARISYSLLPPELTSKFDYDRKAAAEQRKAEQAREARFEREVARELGEKQDGVEELAEEESAGELEKLAELDARNSRSVASIEGYIRRLERGIENGQSEVADCRRRAADCRTKAQPRVVYADDGTIFYTRPSTLKLSRADYWDRKAERINVKIRQAEDLIREAKAKIVVLQAEQEDNGD